MQMIFFVSPSAAAAITETFSEKGKKEAISLKKNNTPDCTVMDYVFRLTRTSVSGIFDGILMEPVTEREPMSGENYAEIYFSQHALCCKQQPWIVRYCMGMIKYSFWQQLLEHTSSLAAFEDVKLLNNSFRNCLLRAEMVNVVLGSPA